MHKAFEIAMGAYIYLLGAVAGLSHWLGSSAGDPAQSYTTAALVVSSVLLGLICCIWAIITQLRHKSYRQAMRSALARAQADIRFRETMISACPEAIAVLGTDMSEPLSYRGGSGLLQACLEGPDAPVLAAKLETLLANGTAFSTFVRTASFPQVSVRGAAVGSRAAVFFRIDKDATEPEGDFTAVLDALPIPVWIRNRHLVLTWANRAFLAATGSATLRDALLSDAHLDRSERDLARGTTEGGDVVAVRRFAVIQGERRALSIDMRRLRDKSVASFALDHTDVAKAEAKLQLSIDSFGAVLNTLDTAVAIFGADQRLNQYNSAYSRMWNLSEPWLQSHPSLSDILDRLRETRRLPEQRNFAAWKQEHLQQFEAADHNIIETWHLPMGISVDVRSVPYQTGGAVYLFRDISDQLRKEETHQLLIHSQRAVLETIPDATAMFGPDGRLKIHNDAFAKLWQLEENELTGEPHLSKVADLCANRTGRDGIWSMIAAGVNAPNPERFGEWGQILRADGRSLTLSLVRLPDGATLVSFSDMTDVQRFQNVLAENAAIAAA